MSARDDVRAELVARLDEVAGSLVAAIVEEIPAYAALSEPQLAEVGAIAEWAITRVLQLWVEDGELSAADVARFRGIGAVRALDGRPLPGVLRAYRLAGTRIFDLVEQGGRTRLGTSDVLALSRLWMATIDTLSEALYAGHVAAADRAAGDRSQAASELLDDLLRGRHVARTGLADRLRLLGRSIGPRVDLLVVTARDATTEVTRGALEVLVTDDLGAEASSTLVTVDASAGVAVLPVGSVLAAAPVLRRRWRGCVLADRRVADLLGAYRLGAHALAHAPERAFDRGPVLDEADAQAVGAATAHPDADPERFRALVTDRLSPGAADHLLVGLEAHLRTGSAAEAAQTLHVHPQTMRYRLARIDELTGRDPRRLWDRFVLEMAALNR